MNKRLALTIIICLISATALACSNVPNMPGETAAVSRGDIVLTVEVNGNLEMPRKADLSFGVSGTVKEVLVDEGDRVTKGQTLARLDARSLELNVAAAEAQYEIAQINLMKTIYPHYTKTWGVDLPGVWLALEEAEKSLKDAQALLDQGKTAEAQVLLGSVQENLDKAKGKSLFAAWQLPWSVRMLELQVDVARANLDAAKVNLEKAVIVAPFDGVITRVNISEGKEVTSMTLANPAISMVDPGEILMRGFIDELDISKVKVGQQANIVLDALPDKDVKGRVSFISPVGSVQAGVVVYDTTITLENPDDELRDGMSAIAEIVIQRKDNVLLIPNKAIRGTARNPTVVVLTQGQTEERQISLGLSDGVNTEVVSGLKEGEIILLPPPKVQPRTLFE